MPLLPLTYRRPSFVPKPLVCRGSDLSSSALLTEENGASVRSGRPGTPQGIPPALTFDKIVDGGTCPVRALLTSSLSSSSAGPATNRPRSALHHPRLHELLDIHRAVGGEPPILPLVPRLRRAVQRRRHGRHGPRARVDTGHGGRGLGGRPEGARREAPQGTRRRRHLQGHRLREEGPRGCAPRGRRPAGARP